MLDLSIKNFGVLLLQIILSKKQVQITCRKASAEAMGTKWAWESGHLEGTRTAFGQGQAEAHSVGTLRGAGTEMGRGRKASRAA